MKKLKKIYFFKILIIYLIENYKKYIEAKKIKTTIVEYKNFLF